MQTGAMVESEVQDRADRWHRMQIHPHRALDGRADGAIISLVDIHTLKHDVADAEWERDYARNISSRQCKFHSSSSTGNSVSFRRTRPFSRPWV